MQEYSPFFIKQLKLGFLFVRNFTYLIVDEASRQAAIVDPAWEVETIASTIDDLNITLATILLTSTSKKETS